MLNNELWQKSAAGGASFYDHQINQSVRFDRASESYLTQTFSGAGNRRTGTISMWVKRGGLGTLQCNFNAHVDNGNQDQLMQFRADDTFANFFNAANSADVCTIRKFRDTSGWNHLILAWDTTQGTDTNRVKIYLNGAQMTDVVKNDGGTVRFMDEDFETFVFGANLHVLGRRTANTSDYSDCYMAEVIAIDGLQLTPSSFGETKNGVWIPKDASGLTFGTNGFHLDFANSSALGNDVSGNNNDFDGVNNMGADHQVLDSPTIGTG